MKWCFLSLYLFFLALPVSHAQQIEIKKTVWEKIYLLEGVKLSFNDINTLTAPYPEAQAYMERAKSTGSTATFLGMLGGGLLGFGVGSLIATRDSRAGYYTLGIGAIIVIIAIPVSIKSGRHVYHAVNIYNDAQDLSLNTSPKTEIQLSLTGNGIGFQYRF